MNKEYLRQWYQKNKERIKQEYEKTKEERNAKRRVARLTNPQIKKTEQKWQQANVELRREYCRKYQNDPVKKVSMRKRKQQYWQKIKTNPQVKIALYARTKIREALKGMKERPNVFRLLGCSIVDYKKYLESRFAPEMTWENYGSYWHIDHIIPCVAFDMTDDEQLRKCFHYTNTQPLPAFANRSKGNKIQGLA